MAHTLLFAKGLPPEAPVTPVRSSWGLRAGVGWVGGAKVSGVNSQERTLLELVTDVVEESTDSNSNSQERSLLVTDLGDQNQRLEKQLAEAEEAALDLRAQVLVGC